MKKQFTVDTLRRLLNQISAAGSGKNMMICLAPGIP